MDRDKTYPLLDLCSEDSETRRLLEQCTTEQLLRKEQLTRQALREPSELGIALLHYLQLLQEELIARGIWYPPFGS